MYQLVNPTLLQSIAFRVWQINLPKIVRQCVQLSSSPPGSVTDLWWAMMIGWVMWVMKVNQNVKKAPLSHQKMKTSYLYYIQLMKIGQVIQATKVIWNAKKGPLSHEKMKCSFLDYIQLLMISRAIWVMKFSWNVKKGPLSHHKMKCSFLDYIQLLMFGWAIRAMKLDWNVTKGTLSHRTMKYSFLGYIQLLMIGQAIQVMKVDQNAKKWNVVSGRVFCCFSLGLLLFQSGSSVCPPPDGKVGNRVAEKFRFFRFMFNKFQPKGNSVQFFHHLLAMQLICDGQCANWLTLHFYNL